MTSSSLRMRCNETPECRVIEVAGRLDASNASFFESVALAAIAACRHVVIDLRGLTAVSHGSAGSLIAVANHGGLRGAQVEFVGLGSASRTFTYVRDALQRLGVTLS